MSDFDVQFQVAALVGAARTAQEAGDDSLQLDVVLPHIDALARMTGLYERLAERDAA